MGVVIPFRKLAEPKPIEFRPEPCPVIDFDYFEQTGEKLPLPGFVVSDLVAAQRKLRDTELLRFFEQALADAVAETDRCLMNIQAMLDAEQADNPA